ncbi:MAG: hypothetical protein ABSB41_18685, partial [Anaerolineales bacterium]
GTSYSLPFNNRLDEAVRTERGRLRRACPEKLSPSGDRERHYSGIITASPACYTPDIPKAPEGILP